MNKKAIALFKKTEAKKDKKHAKVDRAYEKQKVKNAKSKALEGKKLEEKLYHDIIESEA